MMADSSLPTGTDATIAEHIARIIEREYVQATGSGATKYLTPSKLGIGLVEGYNKIGFDRSLTKPFLRREVRPTKYCNCVCGRARTDNLTRSE